MCDLRTLVNETDVIVFDFDLTLARTDLPSPTGQTVETAYADGLDRIFGSTAFLKRLGGVQNPAPAEIAAAAVALLREKTGEKWMGEIFAYEMLNHARLAPLVPEGKGVDCAYAFSVHDPVGTLAETLAREKLALLSEECGPSWPRAYEGVTSFFERYGSRPWGLISSGHDYFIRKTFSAWGVPFSELTVTDDDLRGLSLPVNVKTKPHRFVMESWLARAVHAGTSFAYQRILYVGDDLNKDRGLAHNAGTRFAWFNPDGKPGELDEDEAEFRHYDELTEALA